MGSKSPSTGLLTNVARYIRGVRAGHRDAPESQHTTRSSESSRPALVALLRRKRRDDQVRRREFDKLRALRKSRGVAGGDNRVDAARSAIIRKSTRVGSEIRASTVKKIDAIEANMFTAWADGRAPTPVSQMPQAPISCVPETVVPASAERSAPVAQRHSMTPDTVPAMSEILLGPIESGLQDAAMRFAEGDSATAEATLLGLLQDEAIAPDDADRLVFALFDLYRATGQQDGFDVVAMDYAERFGRSPAEWFCLPTMLAQASVAAPAVITASLQVPDPAGAWECTAVLDVPALDALKALFASASVPWRIHWGALTQIAPLAGPALLELMAYWRQHPVELHWSGEEALLRTLQQHTSANDPGQDPLWWRLRLDALCILQRHEAFERVALDYCVVYEVSPPCWELAQCHLVHEFPSTTFSDAADELAPVLSEEASAHDVHCQLSGELVGEMTQVLAGLYAASQAGAHVVVSCAQLARVDFTAGGALLNWVVTCQRQGCQVQFVHVPRLVAVFFQVLEVGRYAKIAVRTH